MLYKKLLVLPLLMFCVLGYAQTTEIKIGKDNDSNYIDNLIFSSMGRLIRSQSIYLASEIGQTGKITKLTYQLTNVGTYYAYDDNGKYLGKQPHKLVTDPNDKAWNEMNKWEVRMAMTDRAEFKEYNPSVTWLYKDPTNNPVLFDGKVKVLDDHKTIEVTLTTPFDYNDKTKNLVIEIFEKEKGTTENSEKYIIDAYNKFKRDGTHKYRYAHQCNIYGKDEFGRVTKQNEIPKVTLTMEGVTSSVKITKFPKNDSVCEGDNYTIKGVEVAQTEGGVTYEWTVEPATAGELNSNTIKEPVFTPKTAGNVVLKLKVTKGTEKDEKQFTLMVAKKPVAEIKKGKK
ncbi:MAG: hypothetical protein KGV44_03055 [Flavobacteriaceae bacterium]|nr:hypothetical protein [Flavobacteriaceae bacterium]